VNSDQQSVTTKRKKKLSAFNRQLSANKKNTGNRRQNAENQKPITKARKLEGTKNGRYV